MDTMTMIDLDQLHKESIIIDTHCDTLGRVLEGQRRLGERSTLGQFDLVRALEGGLTAELMATFFSDNRAGTGARQSLQFIDVYHQELEAYSDLAIPALKASDVLKAKEQNKIALFLSMEGAEGLEGDLRILRTCYQLGLRFLGLTWNRRNEAADGIGELQTNSGLTNFGRKLVKECNRLGILLDLAHLNPAGVKDVLELSEAPVIATHANAHAVHPHPRNLTDAQLEAIAKTGGVVGVVPVPPFLGDYPQQAPLEPLFHHLDHIVKIMGEDHVGLGLDFDGVGEMRTQGIEDVSKLPNLSRGLVERGYGATTIKKILGGNFLRVFEAVL